MMNPVTVTIQVSAFPPAVFAALTTPQELERWIAASASVDLREGGSVDFGWRRGGPRTIHAVEADKILEYAWQFGDEGETVVRWELAESDGATRVTVVHSGFGNESIRDRYREGWTRHVARLADAVGAPGGLPVVRVSQDAGILPEDAGVASAGHQGGTVATADVAGRSIQYRLGGGGPPTVVLISGTAGDHTHFEPVFDRLAQRATVIAYDRSGYGGSDPAPDGGDGMRWQVQELDALLRSLALPQPYLLAGHGVGALIGQLYALGNREAVAGIVSVNGDDGLPPPDVETIAELPPEVEQGLVEAMFRNLPDEIKAAFVTQPSKTRDAAAAEMADAPAGLARLHEASAEGRLPRVPFVHIGVIPNFDGPEDLLPQPMEEVQDKLRIKHRRTASAYQNGEYVEANTGPFVQFDDPDLLCNVIERLIAQA